MSSVYAGFRGVVYCVDWGSDFINLLICID